MFPDITSYVHLVWVLLESDRSLFGVRRVPVTPESAVVSKETQKEENDGRPNKKGGDIQKRLENRGGTNI